MHAVILHFPRMNLQHKVSEVKSVKSLASDDADARERQLKIAFAKKITSFRKV
jgi:hypothetical protein